MTSIHFTKDFKPQIILICLYPNFINVITLNYEYSGGNVLPYAEFAVIGWTEIVKP